MQELDYGRDSFLSPGPKCPSTLKRSKTTEVAASPAVKLEHLLGVNFHLPHMEAEAPERPSSDSHFPASIRERNSGGPETGVSSQVTS